MCFGVRIRHCAPLERGYWRYRPSIDISLLWSENDLYRPSGALIYLVIRIAINISLLWSENDLCCFSWVLDCVYSIFYTTHVAPPGLNVSPDPSGITHHVSLSDHYIKKPLINQLHHANIGNELNEPINQ